MASRALVSYALIILIGLITRDANHVVKCTPVPISATSSKEYLPRTTGNETLVTVERDTSLGKVSFIENLASSLKIFGGIAVVNSNTSANSEPVVERNNTYSSNATHPNQSDEVSGSLQEVQGENLSEAPSDESEDSGINSRSRMAQISSTIQRHESALDRDIRLYFEKTSTAPKVEVQMLTAKNDYSANSSNLSASTNEAKNHVAQSIMGYIMVQLFEFTRIVRRLFQNFISLAFAPSHVTDSLSANILEQLNILEENFQEFSDVVALNVAATWQAFLKTQPQKVKIESLRKIKTLVREINLGLDSLHRRLTQHLSLNDAVFYLHHSLTVLNKIAGPFNNKLFSNIFSSHVWVSNFISGNIVNEICESKNHWEKNSLEITAGALRNILSSFGNFVDEYLLYLNLNAIFSTIDAEMIRQAIDFSCFYINEVAGVEPIGIKNILNKNNSSMVPYSEDVETSGGDRLLVRNRRMLGGWDDLFDINVFTERVKELPFMQKEWNFGKMLESMKKSMNIAWLALASGDAKVLTIASFGDILSPALNSGSDLHKQCSDLIGKLQFYRRSTLKDMEGLMRILLERATALKCYELGSSDPILRRLQFLLNILKTKRNVVEDPDDPLNIAKRRMEVAMLHPSRRKLH